MGGSATEIPAASRERATETLSGTLFTELLERQVALYGRLEKLVNKQRELVSHDDPKPLLSLLGERKQLTTALTAVAERMGSLPVQWERVRGSLSQAGRARCEALLRRVRQSLRDIIRADGQDVRRLEVRKKKVGDELGGMVTRGAMLSAYGARPEVRATMDRTDESR